MQKVNELFDKEIVDQVTGEKQGTIRDVVFDGKTRAITALLIGGRIGRNRVVRWGSIVSLGDVVVIGGETPPVRLGDDPKMADLHKKGHRITGTDVVTEGGEKIGTVTDLFVDERGLVVGYEVSRGLVSDLGGRKFLAAGNVRTVGKDAIITGNSDLTSVRDAERGRD